MTRPLLAIETSGARGGVAVLLPDGRLIERELAEAPSPGRRPSGHGRMLVPMIDETVAESGIARSDIGAVAVSLGPGSYTGLRIGVAAAKTLAWALGCDLVGVPTLEALARDALDGAPPGAGRLVPAIDARRGEIFTAFFARDGAGLRRATEDEAVTAEELAARLAPGDHVFGTALVSRAGDLLLPEETTSSGGPCAPRAATIAHMGREILAEGRVLDAHGAAPTYLRKPEAELKREARGG